MDTRMLIIDDEYYIRLGIVHAFDWNSMGIEIVGEAADGEEGLQIALEKKPDLILTDICMPFLNGLELMEKLRSEGIESEIIVLSGYDDFAYAQKSIRHGVFDYLLKPIDKEQLKETVAKARMSIQKKKSLESCRQIAETEQSSIKTQFIQDLLFGKLSDQEQINEKLHFLEMPIIGKSFQLAVIQLDDYPSLEMKLSLDELLKLKDTLSDLIKDHFKLENVFSGISTATSNDEWAVLCVYEETEKGTDPMQGLRKQVEGFLHEWESKIEYTLSMSISPVANEINDLPGLYKQVRQDNKKFIANTNSVIWPKTEESQSLRPEVLDVINFVKNHYSEQITVEQAANACYISPSYLMHLFKDNVGKTFNTFLLEYRMEKAKEFLMQPGIQIQNVSVQVGYSDVKYFCKLFKKHTELTPSDYVRKYYAKHQANT